MKKIDFIQDLNVSRETINSFCEYEALLSKWNKKINLVSPNTLADLWVRHFLDSGQIINHVDASGKKWIDIGTGAGFPGLVVALLLRDRKIDCDIILVEKSLKKVFFLKTQRIHSVNQWFHLLLFLLSIVLSLCNLNN